METLNDGLALPLLGMLMLTLVVWVYMFVQRVGYAQANNLDIEQFKTPADAAALIPAEQSAASNNFKNLFEMPVVFYAICLYLMVAGQVAHGASNREIAEALDITERTVKAHLSAIFEKLGVRDRVQLALAMNNIPTYSTVN